MFRKNSVEKISKRLENILTDLHTHIDDQDKVAADLQGKIQKLEIKRDVCKKEIESANLMSQNLHTILMNKE